MLGKSNIYKSVLLMAKWNTWDSGEKIILYKMDRNYSLFFLIKMRSLVK